jgi:hypothetical protein
LIELKRYRTTIRTTITGIDKNWDWSIAFLPIVVILGHQRKAEPPSSGYGNFLKTFVVAGNCDRPPLEGWTIMGTIAQTVESSPPDFQRVGRPDSLGNQGQGAAIKH